MRSRCGVTEPARTQASVLSKRFFRVSRFRSSGKLCAVSQDMKTAIIGLPMVGKTSLFAILTGVTQESRLGSTAVRTGVAKVPDLRVDSLAELYQPPKIT